MRERTCERWRLYAFASVTTTTSSAAGRDGDGNANANETTLIQKSRSSDRSVEKQRSPPRVGGWSVGRTHPHVMVVLYAYVT